MTTILFSKDDFTLIKKTAHQFQLSFPIENTNIILPKILDFPLVKLIYDLNADVYETIQMNILDEYHATLHVVLKHLFADLGMPQRFSHLHITKIVENENKLVRFVSHTIHSEPNLTTNNAVLVPIREMECRCNIIHNHKIQVECNVIFEPHMVIPPVAEKIIGMLFHKMFRRVRQFISQVNVA